MDFPDFRKFAVSDSDAIALLDRTHPEYQTEYVFPPENNLYIANITNLNPG